MKKNTLFKKITQSIIAFILIVIISIATTIYEKINFIIIYFKIKFIFENLDITLKDKFKLIKTILRHIFIYDIKVNKRSICTINKEDCNYEAVLNNKYFMIINLNNKYVVKCVENKKED